MVYAERYTHEFLFGTKYLFSLPMKNKLHNITTDSIINPRYLKLHEFVMSLPETFDSLEQAIILRDIRNTIKSVSVEGEKLVIKSFAHPSLLNRYIYGKLRRSKSQRAYHFSQQLRELGFDTPEPIAAIDCFRGNRLIKSFYISQYSNYESFERVFEGALQGKDITLLLDALTDFLVALHEQGVMYNDLNIMNILYRKREDEGYDFQLLDTNRITFHRTLSKRQRIKDLRRLSCPPPIYCYILNHYAEQVGYNAEDFELWGILDRLMLVRRNRWKSKFKSILHR